MPISAGRPGTLRAIERALKTPEKLVFAVAQRENLEKVTPENLHVLGTVARLGPVQRGLSGMQVILQGEHRGIALRIREVEGRLEAVVREAQEMTPLDASDAAFVALQRELRERATELGQRAGLPEEVVSQALESVDDAGRLADLVAAHTEMTPPQRQALLETLAVEERLRRVLVAVQKQLSVLEAQADIQSKVREEVGDKQREFFLREQMKAIQKELGEGDEKNDLEELREKLDELKLRGAGAQGSRPRVEPPAAHRSRGHGVASHPHLPRARDRTAVERAGSRTTRDRRRGRGARRGSLRPRRRQGPSARVPRRAPAAGAPAGRGACRQRCRGGRNEGQAESPARTPGTSPLPSA